MLPLIKKVNQVFIKGNDEKKKTMPTNRDSQEQLQQMAQRAGLHLSEVDMAFVTSFRPYRANQLALSALQGSSQVHVINTEEQIAFLPRVGASVGVIFYPGARVEAEAYAVFLHEMARWGYATFLAKMPLGLAVFGRDRATMLISANAGIQTWILGGHSMGGGMACEFVATHVNVRGLLLYGTFPGCDLSRRNELAVTSIYGTHDAVITPSQVTQARSKLPAQARYVAIEGGIHSFFGDYGPQDGDGQATISQEEARLQILQASRALFRRLEHYGMSF